MNAPDPITVPGYVETLMRFGEERRLVGTLAEPACTALPGAESPGRAGATDPAPVLLLFNAGVLPRMGPHRLYVKLARRFAAAGYTVLRFDLSGHGDSLPSRGTLGYERQSIEDVRTAMDAVAQRTGTHRFVTFGICSGAVLGYATALEDPRIVGCAMFDPYMYPTWRTHVNRMLAVARRDGWLPTVAGWLRRRLAPAPASGAPDAPAAAIDLGLQDPPKETFAAGLGALVDRGTAVLTLYSGSALYQYNYPGQFDDVFGRFGLAGRVGADYLPHVDHTVTTVEAQRFLIGHLLRWMGDTFPR